MPGRLHPPPDRPRIDVPSGGNLRNRGRSDLLEGMRIQQGCAKYGRKEAGVTGGVRLAQPSSIRTNQHQRAGTKGGCMVTDSKSGREFFERQREAIGGLAHRCRLLRSCWEWVNRSTLHRVVAACLAFWAFVIVGNLTLALPWGLLLKAAIGATVVGSIALPLLLLLRARDEPPRKQ